MDKKDKNGQVIEYNSQPYGNCYFQYKDIRIEIDEDVNLIRIMKGNNVIKYWYAQDTIQASKLPKCCDIINEYIKVFE
jgi:hypothetical protein